MAGSCFKKLLRLVVCKTSFYLLLSIFCPQGHEVIVADNFFTGAKRNLEHWVGHPNFEMINHDIVNPLFLQVDEIYHLASPASPPHYMFNPGIITFILRKNEKSGKIYIFTQCACQAFCFLNA